MVRVDGDLDPETGRTVLTAIRSVVDADVRGAGPDSRTPAQRRADALAEICRTYLDRSDRPVVAGERPHLLVSVDEQVLRTGVGMSSIGETDFTAADARRIGCDAAVSRIVRGPRSEVLDLGRKTPVVPPALRRAVVARDATCRFPGCHRPESWTDVHHVVHWADGGPTSLANLLLLCRRHHRSVHDRFALELTDGAPVFRRPDGSILEDRAPP
jgi:5-methylcytosine-specific restriction endonuclease McrA